MNQSVTCLRSKKAKHFVGCLLSEEAALCHDVTLLTSRFPVFLSEAFKSSFLEDFKLYILYIGSPLFVGLFFFKFTICSLLNLKTTFLKRNR